MKKKVVKKKVSSSSSDKKLKRVVKREKKLTPQDASYWENREIGDTERDWGYGLENWIEDYKASVDHPHRDLIVAALQNIEWSYLLEVGCSAGPNLKRIRAAFPEKALFGIDVSAPSIEEAKKFMNDGTELQVASVAQIPYPDNHFDVVLADAVLMYTNDEDIRDVMAELSRVTRRAVIIVDRFDESPEGVAGHIWSRNYPELLKEAGFPNIVDTKLEGFWDTSKNWTKHGYQWVAFK